MMNIHNKYSSLGKSLLSAAVCAGVLSASMGAQADTPKQEVSQVPLALSEGVPPNMIFTLDESGSMSWGHVPDKSSQAYRNLIAIDPGTALSDSGSTGTNTRRYRAARTNPMYYNPNIVYEIPPAFTSAGVEYQLTTSFESAPVNGFDPDNNQGKRNLGNNYRVVREHRIPSGTYEEAEHPFSRSCNVTVRYINETYSCNINGQNVSARVRNNDNGCDNVSPSNINLNVDGAIFRAPLSCSRNGTDLAITASPQVPAYYYEFDGTLDSGRCANRKDNDYAGGEDCYRLRWVGENSAYDKNKQRLTRNGVAIDGRQNFAIWYSFYKTRALATLSATSIAFYDLSSDVRFTWQNLATCTSFTGTTTGDSCGANSLKPYTTKHKGEFYTWLRSVLFNVSTPLPAAMKRAGEYLHTNARPWQKFPGEAAKNTPENTYACRPSYHVMMTDGMWNATTEDPANFRKDDSTFTTPGGVQGGKYAGKEYSAIAPFYDNVTIKNYYNQDVKQTTLADIAMHYWATDLNTNLDNKLPVYIPYKNDDATKEYWDPRNNPAEWQHMSNFIMGLGLTNSLTNPNVPWAGSTFAGEGYAKLKAGTVNWPPASASSLNNVYDLWHSAINSRGEFYSVDSPQAMVQAFKDILTRIADRKDSAAKPGISNSIESDGSEEAPADRLASYFYQTSFDSENGWAGDIKKVKKYRQYNKETQEFEDIVEEGWSAKQKMGLTSAASRNIKIANRSGTGAKLQDFAEGNAGLVNSPSKDSLAYYLNINPEPGTQVATWQQRLEYVRGSRANEGEAAGKLRPRVSLLGDFLSSQPAIVTGARYLEGFANRLEGNTAYTTFMTSIKDRKGQLYIGGNAGMLHAFDTADGAEKFAFIPTAVFPKLNKLTGKNYSHQYFVDGTPVIADVYDKAKSKWRTILVGTLRAGGKGMFALDVTNPASIELLWELDESNFPADLSVKPGYSFPQPTVARLHNGKWAVVTGNGYKSEGANNGAAALYVIDAITGEIIKSLEVQSAVEEPNGLSSPRLADYDADGVADYAYAGDLHGNLWRFDLLGNSATAPSAPTVIPQTNGSYGGKNDGDSKFAVSYGGKPMFIATSTAGTKRQPITSAPSLVRHPTRKGYLVMFGTGKYFEIGDKTGEENFAQSLYGIWDMKTKAETTTADIIPESSLALQTIELETSGTGKVSGKERKARIISNNAVEWYKDFDSSNDEVVKRGWRLDLTTGGFDGEMIVENMTTLGSMLLLQTLVPNDDPCANGSTNWLYAINPATGGRTLHHALDTRTADGGIVSGIKFGSEGGVSISQNETGFTANAPGDSEAIAPPADSMGRQSWRMVPDA